MRKLGWFAGATAPALLAACGVAAPSGNVTVSDAGNAHVTVPQGEAAGGPANAQAAASGPAVNLAPDGLGLVLADGSIRHAPFGQDRATIVAMVSAAAGAPTAQATNAECGGGPLDSVDFKGSLRLWFEGGSFAGWQVDGRGAGPYATAAGIGIGSTLATMRKAGEVKVEESSIGHEFDAGGIGGLLSAPGPRGAVTDLWAGATCIFR